jgi:hypothetical protein
MLALEGPHGRPLQPFVIGADRIIRGLRKWS